MEKKRSEVLERLLKKINEPGYKERMLKERNEEKLKLTSEWQFGYYVGEDIVHRDLPTLSVEGGTRNEIQVSEEDEAEYKRLEKEWYNKYSHDETSAKNEWEEYQKFREILKVKYLPEKLECYRGLMNITNMEEFKDGLITSLWGSDVCNYSLNPEDIKIYDDENCYFTIIELILK